jgi:hypothetical protein
LVIIAVVIVIGLVVASLASGMFDTANVIKTSDELKGQIGSGSISILEGFGDYEGDGILSLKNTSGNLLTLKTVSTSTGENTYNKIIPSNSQEIISMESLDIICPCESGQTTKTCEFEITYINQYGIEHKIKQTTTINCSEETTTQNPTTPQETTLQNCFDLTKNPVPICTLTDLNRIREDLTKDYELKTNINASETINWNLNADYYEGWLPIGSTSTPFIGKLDGKNFSIRNIYLNASHRINNGFFSKIGNSENAAEIINLSLEDINFYGNWHTGTIAGFGENSIIRNVFVSGKLKGVDFYCILGNICFVEEDQPINIGGLLGKGIDSLIQDSNLYLDINHQEFQDFNQFVGYNSETIIENSNFYGEITSFG